MKTLLPKILFIVFISLINKNSYAQLDKPKVEAVYGGRILGIHGIKLDTDSSRIFISTESANSAFYADVFHQAGVEAQIADFKVLPGLSASKNVGGQISKIQGHESSKGMLYLGNTSLGLSNPNSATNIIIESNGVNEFKLSGDNLVYLKGNQLVFGTLNSSRVFTKNSSSPLSVSIPMGRQTFFVHPTTLKLYVFLEGNNPKLYKSTEAVGSFTSSTNFTDISPALTGMYMWTAFGIAPDGSMFIGGSNNMFKFVAFSKDEISYTQISTNQNGISGQNFAFSGDSASYKVFFSKCYNKNKGIAGSWKTFGDSLGSETHPNDGPVGVDPKADSVIYMTTDQGIGASTNYGAKIFEIDEGVEAVQVDDFDMTTDKSTAWLASKAGIRKVSSYTTTPKWTKAIFPNNDGSPYYSAAMAKDTNIVFVGNSRIYRSLDGGTNWIQVFTPENAPYNFPGVGTRCEAIETCPLDSSIALVGYYNQSGLGGVFYTFDRGNSWNQVLLDAGAKGQDVNVHDIVFSKEGADTVAYVSVEALGNPGDPFSIYRLVKSGYAWNATQNMDGANTSTGSVIVATIRDMAVTASGDTLLATGNDVGINHPVVYYKINSGTNKWTPFPTSGFPATSNKKGSAITFGIDTVYCAVDNDVYFLPFASTAWALGYSYPNGTRINVLYFDDLLIGTGTGFYSQKGKQKTGMQNRVKQSDLLIYPNPVVDQLIINFIPQSGTKIEINIFDNKGAKLRKFEYKIYSNYIDINTNELAAGMYSISITEGKKIRSGKFIKQ